MYAILLPWIFFKQSKQNDNYQIFLLFVIIIVVVATYGEESYCFPLYSRLITHCCCSMLVYLLFEAIELVLSRICIIIIIIILLADHTSALFCITFNRWLSWLPRHVIWKPFIECWRSSI